MGAYSKLSPLGKLRKETAQNRIFTLVLFTKLGQFLHPMILCLNFERMC